MPIWTHALVKSCQHTELIFLSLLLNFRSKHMPACILNIWLACTHTGSKWWIGSSQWSLASMGKSRDRRRFLKGPVDNICEKRAIIFKILSTRVTTSEHILATFPTLEHQDNQRRESAGIRSLAQEFLAAMRFGFMCHSWHCQAAAVALN